MRQPKPSLIVYHIRALVIALSMVPSKVVIRAGDDGLCPPNSPGCSYNSNGDSGVDSSNPQATGLGLPGPSTTSDPFDFTVHHWPRAQIIIGVVIIVVFVLTITLGTLAIIRGWTNKGLVRLCARRRGYKTRFEKTPPKSTLGSNATPVTLSSEVEQMGRSSATTVDGESACTSDVRLEFRSSGLPQESSQARLIGVKEV